MRRSAVRRVPRVEIPEDELSQLIISRVEAYRRDLDGRQGLPLLDMIVMAAERPLICWAMEQCGCNQRAAAKLLGINRNTLHTKLEMYGLLAESN
jgi:Fis family transcriptional regulator